MFDYMIYILTFAIGSIIGLIYSYKKHSEPFVAISNFNMLYGIISIIGWVLVFNANNIFLQSIGFLLAGFILGERPGYGRRESAIGLVVSIIVYLILQFGIR